jgi:hypothetical protein
MNTYTHVMPILLRDAAEKMDAIFARSVTLPAGGGVSLQCWWLSTGLSTCPA